MIELDNISRAVLAQMVRESNKNSLDNLRNIADLFVKNLNLEYENKKLHAENKQLKETLNKKMGAEDYGPGYWGPTDVHDNPVERNDNKSNYSLNEAYYKK